VTRGVTQARVASVAFPCDRWPSRNRVTARQRSLRKHSGRGSASTVDPGLYLRRDAELAVGGLLFESLVCDLRVSGQPRYAEVYIYGDNALEVDAIVVGRGTGRWAAFEIKLGGRDLIEQAARSLLRFRERVDTAKVGDPACLGVIVATGLTFEPSRIVRPAVRTNLDRHEDRREGQPDGARACIGQNDPQRSERARIAVVRTSTSSASSPARNV
jgi:hypothetical protein